MITKTNLTLEEQKDWDTIQEARKASFLQSSWWGQFRQSYGDRVYFCSDDDWAALIIEAKTPLGIYWVAPYGPPADSKGAMKKASQTLVTEAKKAGAIFLRIEPQQADLFDPKDFKKAPASYNPAHTVIVDLSRPEEEIMASMKQNNRSLVRRAKREGATFERSNDPASIKLYLKMQKNVADRTGVTFYPSSYYEKQAELLMANSHMAVEIAYDPEGKPQATAITHDYSGKTTYTYAASLDGARKLDLGRFLVYESMIHAKKRGQKLYDLYGIAGPNAKKDDPWHGFSFFKKQFGGEEATFAGTWDKPLNTAKYTAYRLHGKIAHEKKRLKQRRLKKAA